MKTDQAEQLKMYIRDVPDWPKVGILFRDITPLLADAKAFAGAIEAISSDYIDADIQYVVGVEARGFIFGSAVAEKLGIGFVVIRKNGKLPPETEKVTYDLEYGTDTLEIHKDAFGSQSKVLIVDDLLATGGTMTAACKLVEKIDGEVAGISFLIELTELAGREKLGGYQISTVISY